MPNNNFIHEAGTLPTAVQAALNDFVAGFELRGARVAENKPHGPGSMEELLHEGLAILQTAHPDRVASARTKMRAPLGLVKTHPRFARYATANLDVANGLDQADIARNTFHRTALSSLRAGYVHIAAPLSPQSAPPNILVPQGEYKTLKLFLNEVRCIDETGSGIGEWGSDETYLTSIAVDENGESQNARQWKIRSFDDNTTLVYGTPPPVLANFDIHEGGNTFPKVYSLTINLMEHDFGSIAAWFKKVADAVKSEVAKYIGGVIGGMIGMALGPVGAAVGAAIGAALNKIIDLIGGWLGDDNIGTRTVQSTIHSYTGKLQNNHASMTGSFDLTGSSSHYRVFYTWALA